MPEISRNRQNARYAEDVVSVKDFGAIGDGVTDDTTAIQAALDYIGSVATATTDAIPALKLDAGTYNITSQLTCPSLKWHLTSDGDAVIKVDSLAIATPPFSNFVRGSVIENVIIKDTTSARTRYGWYFESTSQLTLINIQAVGLEKGFIFNGANDFASISGIIGYNNKNDVLFETTINTSLTFNSCRFDESTEGAVVVNSSLTNVHFVDGGFIMKPTSNSIVNFNVNEQSCIACSLRGNRFEHKGTGLTATHLYIRGASATFPASFRVENNYFSNGDVDQHIHLNGRIGVTPIDGNHFQDEPNVADILNSVSNANLDVRDTNFASPSRTTTYVIFSDTASAAYLEHKVNPVLIKLDRIELPTDTAGSQSATITYASETRSPNIDMPNSVQRYELHYRGNTTGTPILDGFPVADQITTSTIRFRYNVRTAVASSAQQFDLYLWGY